MLIRHVYAIVDYVPIRGYFVVTLNKALIVHVLYLCGHSLLAFMYIPESVGLR